MRFATSSCSEGRLGRGHGCRPCLLRHGLGSRRPRLSTRGQATIEAAVLLPVVFSLLMLLAQPAILLFDRMVMEGAAAQGLRMLASRSSDTPDRGIERLIEAQLAPIPAIDIFHAGGSAWDIEIQGDEASDEVSVTIVNRVRPLPLLGAPLYLAGALGSDGLVELSVTVSAAPQPSWARGHSGSDWTNRWD